jgi:hypothetical protein
MTTAPLVDADPIGQLQHAVEEARLVRAEAERDLADLDAQGTASANELERLTSRVASAPLRGAALTRIRNQRRKLRELGEDTAADRGLFELRVVEARQRERQAVVALHAALRMEVHRDGKELGRELRDQAALLDRVLARWTTLAAADRRYVDVLRSLDQSAMNTLPTLDFACGVSGPMVAAAGELVAQVRRVEADLAKRAEAAKGNS